MTTELKFADLPNVLDDDATEFVLRFEPDQRPATSIGGAAYRRGSERYVIEWPLDWLRLRATVTSFGSECFVAANIGPLLNEWWPLLMRSKPDSQRPLLSAGASNRASIFVEPEQQLSVRVEFLRGGEGPPATFAVTKFSGGMTEDNMLIAHAASLGVIKAALLTLVEYRTLHAAIPALNISTEGSSILLSRLIEIAEAAANALTWTHQPDGA